MSNDSVVFRPIGVIRSEHVVPHETPIQPVYARDCRGRVELLPEFADGLHDIDGFSHIYLIYHLDRAEAPKLRVKPYLQDKEHGIFSTRFPQRPNAIGLSIVELISRDGNVLHFNGADILDGTPLLDIKPFTAKFDSITPGRNGWYDEVDEATAQHRGRRGFRGRKSE